MKRFRTILILGLIILAAAAAWALAAEPARPAVPLRDRVVELLQQHPELWAEIQALKQEYGLPAADGEMRPAAGPWGRMKGGGRMMQEGRMRQRARYCWPSEQSFE